MADKLSGALAAKGIEMAANYQDRTDPLSFIMTVFAIVAFAAAGASVWYVLKNKKDFDAKIEAAAAKRIAELEDGCAHKVNSLKQQHASEFRTEQMHHQKEIVALKEAHARELAILNEKVADLVLSIPTQMDRMNGLLTGFREDLRRIYDKLSDSSEKSAGTNIENVKVLTQIAAALSNLPNAIKLMVREILAEKQNSTRS